MAPRASRHVAPYGWLLVVLLLLLPHCCWAWTTPSLWTTTTSPSLLLSSRASQLAAKPPPAASFDLQAIEAYESQLDAAEEEQQQQALLLLASKQQQQQQEELLLDDDDLLLSNDANDKAIIVLTVPPELDQKRIDAALAQLLADNDDDDNSMSRSQCGSLVANGGVSVLVVQQDGDAAAAAGPTKEEEIVDRKSFKVTAGQVLRVVLQSNNVNNNSHRPPQPQPLPLDILYEDEHMIVLNKSAGMVVHPAVGNWDGTVVNALLHYLRVDEENNNSNNSPYGAGDCFTRSNNDDDDSTTTPASSRSLLLRPGIVHRLDKGTTGVLVVAKTSQALAALSQQFANRTVQKTYLAIAIGNPGERVVIDKPIGRHPVHRQRMRVVPNNSNNSSNSVSSNSSSGRPARSLVHTLAFDGRLSLVRVRIETGRTHQIRVHLQDRHTPIYGDEIYGRRDWNQKLVAQQYKKQEQQQQQQQSTDATTSTEQQLLLRPLLHAYQLKLQHPVTGESMVFRAPLAPDMLRLARILYPEGPEVLPDAFGTAANDDST